MNKARNLSIAAMLFTTFIWGISFSSTKVLLESLGAAEIAFLRLVLATAALALVYQAARQKGPARADLARLAAGGFTGTFLYFVFQNYGLNYTTAGNASMVASTAPVLNVIAGCLFFRERFRSRQWLGVLLSMGGVFAIVYWSAGGLALSGIKGNAMIFGAAASWVIFTRINEPLTGRYSNITLTFFQTLAGMVYFGFLALPGGLHLAALDLSGYLNLAFLGLLCSAAAFFFYLYALKHLGSTAVTTSLNLVPVFGVLGGIVILRESLSWGQVLGAALVVLGVSLVTYVRTGEKAGVSPGAAGSAKAPPPAVEG